MVNKILFKVLSLLQEHDCPDSITDIYKHQLTLHMKNPSEDREKRMLNNAISILSSHRSTIANKLICCWDKMEEYEKSGDKNAMLKHQNTLLLYTSAESDISAMLEELESAVGKSE